MPGQTAWRTVVSFVEAFALTVYVGDSAGEFTYATVKIPAPEGLSLYPNHDYTIRDGIVEAIEVDDPGPSPSFAFLEFVNAYGPPEEVWIRTYSEGVREVGPSFQVALFYPGEGIVAAYGVEGTVQGERVRGCPQRASRPWLGLWSPELEVTFYEAADMFRWDREDWPFLPLDKGAGMDVETFFKVFSDPNNVSCLETPADLWTPQF